MALALLRFTFRHLARNSTSLADLSTRMSAALHEEWHGSPYVTYVIARVDVARRTLTYVNAGHPPGMLVREGQDYQLTEGGPPLGLFECATYVESQLDLIDGDVCAFMTDGITEAFDNGLGSSRTVVIDAVREEGRSASAVCYAVMERARDAHGPKDIEDWTDDRTIVVVAFNESLTYPINAARLRAPGPLAPLPESSAVVTYSILRPVPESATRSQSIASCGGRHSHAGSGADWFAR